MLNSELSLRITEGGVELRRISGPSDSGSPIITLTDAMIARVLEVQRGRQLRVERDRVLDAGNIDELYCCRHP